MDDRYTFIETLLDEAKSDFRKRGVRALVPWYLVLSVIAGATIVFFVPRDFYGQINQDVSATMYAGILAFNAITLALSWSAIAKVLEIITQKDFSTFLRNNGLVSIYRFYVELVHGTQIVAAFVSLMAMLILMVGSAVPDLVHQCLLGATITFTLYAVRWSHGAAQIANDLIFQYSKFDGLNDSEKSALRMAVNNGSR